jgi:chemotaxis protein MotB
MKNWSRESSAPDDNMLGSLPILMKKAGPKAGPKPLRFQNKPQTEKGNEIWLVTLSDLLMLLMIFFVVLFGMALQREIKAHPSVQAAAAVQLEAKENEIVNPARVVLTSTPTPSWTRTNASTSLETDLIAALQREKGQSDVMIERIADRVILTFPERIVFDPGQAKLKPSAQTTLDKVASFINERPFLIVEVQGHTDDRPINNNRYPSNWELSVDRAMQVSRALIGLGVNPTQLSVKGFGEYRPHVPNDSDVSRLTNRRVEIQFSDPPNDEIS